MIDHGKPCYLGGAEGRSPDKKVVVIFDERGNYEPLMLPRIPAMAPPAQNNENLFEWGTSSNRSMLLAEAILTDALSDASIKITKNMVEAFHRDIIATSAKEGFHCTIEKVEKWALSYVNKMMERGNEQRD